VPRTQWSLAPFGFGGYRVSARTSSHRSALYLLAILFALDLVVIALSLSLAFTFFTSSFFWQAAAIVDCMGLT
jgi:hypothetical protein